MINLKKLSNLTQQAEFSSCTAYTIFQFSFLQISIDIKNIIYTELH